jgi:uncharacterized damage-inducible protein DinB
MTVARPLADRLERTVNGPMWHGPALRELLGDVSYEAAAARPIAGAHSIWELVVHISAWADIARARLAATPAPTVTPDEDWPPVGDPTPARWAADVARLGESYRELASAVAMLEDRSLAEVVPGRDYSRIDMVHGVIEHGTYHGGQIALLKRALGTRPNLRV